MIARLAMLAALQSAPGPGPQVAIVIQPDTVRVGELFTVALAVSSPGDTAVRFPAALRLDSLAENVGLPALSADAGAGRWRAAYQAVAWKAGELILPPITLRFAGGPGLSPRVLDAHSPPLTVSSVLPADTAALALMAPRPPLAAASWWWLLLLLLALLAAYLWWRWRRRKRAAQADALADPATRAISRLRALEDRFRAAGIPQDVYYDDLEQVLRQYVEETRPWPAGTPLTAPRPDAAKVAETLGRSVRARFGRTGSDRQVAAGDVEACVDWLEADREQVEAVAAPEAGA
ncbi:MAG: hypothetical protein ABFS14_07705 [Gemmatimonadota bacterium]